jgi:hypothetical protein
MIHAYRRDLIHVSSLNSQSLNGSNMICMCVVCAITIGLYSFLVSICNFVELVVFELTSSSSVTKGPCDSNRQQCSGLRVRAFSLYLSSFLATGVSRVAGVGLPCYSAEIRCYMRR